jgi:hypothetical protein
VGYIGRETVVRVGEAKVEVGEMTVVGEESKVEVGKARG